MSEHDLQALIGDIYAAALEPDIAPDALARMCALTGSSNGAIGFWHDLRTDFRNILFGDRLDADERSLYLEVLPQDLDYQRRRSLPAGKAVLGQAYAPLEEYRRLDVFSFNRRVGCVHRLAMPVLREPNLLVDVTLYRPEKRVEHGAHELRIADLLLPHLRRSFAMARQLHPIQARASQLEEALSRAVPACLIVECTGKLVFASDSGGAALSGNGPLRVADGNVVADTAANRKKWETVLGRLASPDAVGSGVMLDTERGPLPLLAVPLTPGRHRALGFAAAPFQCGLVAVGRPTEPPKTASALLRHLYRLTAAEAEVAVALANGETLKDYSERRRRALTTAKTHLRAAFAKTGTSRQSELVRLIAGISSVRLERGDTNS